MLKTTHQHNSLSAPTCIFRVNSLLWSLMKYTPLVLGEAVDTLSSLVSCGLVFRGSLSHTEEEL